MDRRTFLHALGASPVAAGLATPPTGLINDISHAPINASGPYSTGLAALDDLLGSFGPGDLILLAGPRLCGKTTLALTVARYVCETQRLNAIYWGSHIQDHPYLGKTCQSLRSMSYGAIHIQCSNEPLNSHSATPGSLGILIVDEFEHHLTVTEPAWRNHPKHALNQPGRFRRLATDLGCVVIATIQISMVPPAQPEWTWQAPRVETLGEIGRAMQTAGRVLTMFRPFVYDPSRIRLQNVADIGRASHCAHPGQLGGSILIPYDTDTGLYRDFAAEELAELYSDDAQFGSAAG